MIPVGLPWSFISFYTCKLRQLDGLSKCQQRTTSGWGKGHVARWNLGPPSTGIDGVTWGPYKMAKLSMGIRGAISQFHRLYTQKNLISNLDQKTHVFSQKKCPKKLPNLTFISAICTHTWGVLHQPPPLVASKTRPVRSCNPRLSRIQCCAAPAAAFAGCFEGDPKIVLPGDSKWPCYPLVGGHLNL